MKKTVCLDFDGVIHSYESGWQGAYFIPDPPVPGTMQFILEAIEKYEIKIYSSRSHQDGGIIAMNNWMRYWLRRELPLEKANYVYNILNKNYGGQLEGFPTSKPSAYVSVDDRALTFNGDWKEIARKIENFQPWNKK